MGSSSDGKNNAKSRDFCRTLSQEFQLSDLQHLQKTLRSMSDDKSTGCCPVLFERASAAWWNPRFDSSILEGQYWRSTFPRTTQRFQIGLCYLFFLCLSWSIYFPVVGSPHWPVFLAFSLSTMVLFVVIAGLTLTEIYSRYCFKVSLLLSLLLCVLSLLVYLTLPSGESMTSTLGNTDISEAGLFTLYVEVVLLIYTLVPLPLYGTGLVCIIYAAVYEIVAAAHLPPRHHVTVIVHCLLHLCIHVIGAHNLIMTQVRMRDTFMKVGQSLMVKRQLGMEKQLKEKMIHSVMPPKVADWLMKEGHTDDPDDMDIESETGSMMRKISSPRSSNQGDIRTIFRPFNMNAMDNVSILFADIVGFTKMSSNKTASQLVGLLNDLFGRFDHMCTKCCCEKISTLGDCYYCVSGCPEPTPDHASNCVEMGLNMIKAIKDFDNDCNECVNMRVGIHTGTVLCGIVGKKRFKFDVWSNDVTFANRMESTGKPGMVHISGKTYEFLKDDYHVQQADGLDVRCPGPVNQAGRVDILIKQLKTYFISGRKSNSAYHLKLDQQQKSNKVNIMTGPEEEDIKININHHNGTKSLPILGSNEEKDGKMSLNKLYNKLLRQRSAPSQTPEINVINNEESDADLNNTNNQMDKIKQDANLKISHLSKSEGSTPAKEVRLLCNDEVAASVPAIHHNQTNILQDSPSSLQDTTDSLQDSTENIQDPPPNNGQTKKGPMSDINNVYCNSNSVFSPTGQTNDIARVFHEVNFSGVVASNDSNSHYDYNPGLPLNESLSKFHQLRKQSDLAMIRSVQEDATHHNYFTNPPLHPITFVFSDPSVEKEYRSTAWKANHSLDPDSDDPTLASSSSNAHFDILVSTMVFAVICFACFVQYKPSRIWLAICIAAAGYHILVIFVCVRMMITPRASRSTFHRLYSWCRRWYPSQIFGAFLVSLPIISLLSNLTCDNFGVLVDASRNYFLNLLVVTIIHFCNFTQLYCWVKSLLATIFAGSIFVFLAIPVCPCDDYQSDVTNNHTHNISGFPTADCGTLYNHFLGELVLDITMLLILVWLLNREFEISYRLSFHCSLLAAKDRKKVLNLKNQADWLLHNIIPEHVSDQLKKSAKYSENHKDVGIIFASLVNFNELYDESYMGGKEYLRVLNELISDFDELLDKSEFRNVEKIKTIGATFMAASGLNPNIRAENQHKYQHIHELMEFAEQLQLAVEEFNQSLIEFDLILRIGVNFGDVTSGVIGTTKLYFDIWGDAVNIASRMDSTGVDGRCQVNERSKDILKQWYEFEERGKIFVKGKDHMNVYLLKKKKESAYRMF